MRSSLKLRSWNTRGQLAAVRFPAASSATTWIFGLAGASRAIAKSATRRPARGASGPEAVPGYG